MHKLELLGAALICAQTVYADFHTFIYSAFIKNE